MSEDEKVWEKKMKAMLKPLEESLGKMSSDLNDLRETQKNLPSSDGEPEMPLYKCKGKDCGYSTDDLGDFVVHTVKENLPKPIEETEPQEAPKKGHKTVEDYLNCPECFPKFEKAFLTRGYKKPELEKKVAGKL